VRVVGVLKRRKNIEETAARSSECYAKTVLRAKDLDERKQENAFKGPKGSQDRWKPPNET
jgi:hypothetical protein